MLVWGQVVDAPTHPEDAAVEFFSHGEQWRGHVRLDRIEEADVPEFAIQCPSLLETKPNRYARCQEHVRHGGDHVSGKYAWGSSHEAGGIDR